MFAWYSLVGMAGAALGQLLCGWTIASLRGLHGWDFIPSCRVIFLAYSAVGVVKLLLVLSLSRKVEATKEEQPNGETRPLLADAPPAREQPAAPETSWFASIDRDLWSLMVRLFILFGLDSFGSGLASLSWMTYFIRRKFGLPEGQLGTIFFVTSSIAAASTLVAASIAKRIGNVKVNPPFAASQGQR